MMAPVAIWSTAILMVVACVASVTDIRQRRIPNQLTFPAIVFGLASHLVAGGWGGALFAATGTLLAPALLSLLHGAKGPGAGDLKLAAVLGANLGPIFGALSILFSAVAGGFLAGFWILGLWLKKSSSAGKPGLQWLPPAPSSPEVGEATEDRDVAHTIIPYGLALSVGSLVALVYYWSVGGERWLM